MCSARQQLSSWVASLEQKILAQKPIAPPAPAPAADEPTPPAAHAHAEAISELLARLAALDAAAGGRPASAPVRYDQKSDDTASVASWSADAFGKSKTPGWYHTSRKEVYQRRSKLASAAPTGTYTSHTKYADEAVRIKNTGRLAF